MRKLGLSDWASVAEIASTVAVIISLVFVIRSIDKNTSELRNAQANYLDSQFVELLSDAANDPELASKLAKLKYGIDIADGTLAQVFWLQRREIGMWESAYYFHREGSLDDEVWNEWNDWYIAYIPASFSEDQWKAIRPAFNPAFALHVDSAYANK